MTVAWTLLLAVAAAGATLLAIRGVRGVRGVRGAGAVRGMRPASGVRGMRSTRVGRPRRPLPLSWIHAGLIGLVVGWGRATLAAGFAGRGERPIDVAADVLAPAAIAAVLTAVVLVAAARVGGLAVGAFAAVAVVVAAGDVLLWRLAPSGLGFAGLLVAVGTALAVLLVPERSVDGRMLGRAAVACSVAGVALLAAPLVPGLGVEVNGARAWVSLPIVGAVMPGELGRVLLVLGAAGMLARHADELGALTSRRWSAGRTVAVRPLVVSTAAAAIGVLLLLLQRDLGPALVVTLAIGVTAWLASGRIRYALLSVSVVLVGALAAYPMFGHWQDRVASWLQPVAGIAADQGQHARAMTAAAWGGLWGTGWGDTLVDRNPGAVPEPDTDYALLQLAAEAGLGSALVVVAMLALVAVLLWTSASWAARSAGPFSLAPASAGLATLYSVQSAVILAGVTGLIPLTGLTTPFLSRGGSSLVAVALLVALATRWGDAAGRPEPRRTEHPAVARRRRDLRLAAASTVACAAAAAWALTTSMTFGAAAVNASEASAQAGWARATARGDIRTADGVTVARTAHRGVFDAAVREYPEGDRYSETVGAAVPFGASTGLEAAQADALTCGDSPHATASTASAAQAEHAAPSAHADPAACRPADLVLTLDSRWQAAAADALAGRTGAVVVQHNPTGRILAAVSTRRADPNPLAAPEVADALAAADATTDALGAPLSPGLWGERHEPGSTMKIAVSVAARLAYGDAIPLDTASCPDATTIDDALAVSCNSVFAALAAALGPDRLAESAALLGLDLDEISGIPIDPFQLVADGTDPTDQGAVNASLLGIGQGDARATLAGLVQAATVIADDGVRIRSHLVARVERDGVPLATDDTQGEPVLPAEVAAAVAHGMRMVVTDGTAPVLDALDGEWAAKSGTAETHDEYWNAWIVGFPSQHNEGDVVGDVTVGVLILPDQTNDRPIGGADAAAVLVDVVTNARTRLVGDAP